MMRHRQGQAGGEGRTDKRGGEDAWLWAPPGRSRLVKSTECSGRRGKARKKEDRWRRGKGRKDKKIEMGESAREEAEWRINRKKQREAGGGARRRKVEWEEHTETQQRKSGEEGERRQERSDLGSFPKDWRLGSGHLLIGHSQKTEQEGARRVLGDGLGASSGRVGSNGGYCASRWE